MAFSLSKEEEIKFIIDSILPFVNIPDKNQDEILQAYPALEKAVKSILHHKAKPTPQTEYFNNQILSIYSFIKYLLTAPLSDKPLEELKQLPFYVLQNDTTGLMADPDNILDAMDLDLETTDTLLCVKLCDLPKNYINKRIEKNICQDTTLISWSSFGDTSVTTVSAQYDFDLDYVEYAAINSIVNTFNSNTTFSGQCVDSSVFNKYNGMQYNQNTAKLAIKGIGFDYIGLCPRCEKFFEKKRKNQFYCSDTCSAAIRVLRNYHKKKETPC